MKRWLSRLGGLLLWPLRAPGRAWRALKRSKPFPGVSWGYLLRFARLPLLVIGIVAGIYVLGLITFIGSEDRWSAAEVFVGLAGGGAALAALAGLAKQFEIPEPRLDLNVWSTRDTGAGATRGVSVINRGSEPAYDVRLAVIASQGPPGARLLVVPRGGWSVESHDSRSGEDGQFAQATLRRNEALQRAHRVEVAAVTWAGELQLYAYSGNGPSVASWESPAPVTPASRSAAPSSPPGASP